MKKVVVLIISLILLVLCAKNNLSGTATDVNSGTIAGVVLNNGAKYYDSVTVALYSGDTIIAKMLASPTNPAKSIVTNNAEFLFDSLVQGVYSIRITKGSLTLGQELNINLPKNAHITVNITINIIINQFFNITNTSNNQNIIINNYYFSNTHGTLDTTSTGQFKAVFTPTDTVYLTGNVKVGNVTDTITIIFVKQPNGSYLSLPVQTPLPINITDGTTIIYNGSGSDSTSVVINGQIKEDGL